MRIAVVTPTIGRESISKAIHSVFAQQGDFAEIHHVVVGDGAETEMVSGVRQHGNGFAHHFCLPTPARDAGATPRAAGVAYAWGAIKPDVIAFLDDDVEWEPGHLALAAQGAVAGADVITSRRWLLEYDTGRRIRVDETDSDGVEFADTSTIALAGRAMWFAATWNKGQLSSGSDREFWSRLRNSTRRIVCHGQPTVLYRTPWAVHYIGEEFRPPNPAKWVATDESGKRIAVLDEPIYNPATQRWEPKSQHQVAIGPEAA